MILASVALEYQIINQRIFVALIVMALITSMLSGPAMQRLLRRRGMFGHREGKDRGMTDGQYSTP